VDNAIIRLLLVQEGVNMKKYFSKHADDIVLFSVLGILVGLRFILHESITFAVVIQTSILVFGIAYGMKYVVLMVVFILKTVLNEGIFNFIMFAFIFIAIVGGLNGIYMIASTMKNSVIDSTLYGTIMFAASVYLFVPIKHLYGQRNEDNVKDL
jgi:hypothetical protein